VSWLISDARRFVTGQIIAVNGGYYLDQRLLRCLAKLEEGREIGVLPQLRMLQGAEAGMEGAVSVG
jgi:hypothetical protein